MEQRTNGVSQRDEMSGFENDSPYCELETKARNWSTPIDSVEFARKLDEEDPLRECRNLFYYPKKKDIVGENASDADDENEECIYLTGQSLGLQLKSTESRVKDALSNWAKRGVECHFSGEYAAAFSDQIAKEKMAHLVGAETNEIAFMNGLTVNIQLMLASFYQPTEERNKILMIDGGFHSDWYAIRSHVLFRGLDPDKIILLLKPKQDKYTLDPSDILSVIEKEGKYISLVYLEGVNYYTGQLFDLKAIAGAARKQGCIVGYDLAHAVGNVKLQLHQWNVDFAVWCTYKYLNSGPGNMGAIFCHNKHTSGNEQIFPKLRGWWGLDFKRKFKFDKDFTPAKGADRFSLSNPSPVLSAMISASLDVFDEVGMDKIQEKQRILTGYLEYLLRKNLPLSNFKNSEIPQIQIITPRDPRQRGSQISLLSSVPSSKCKTLLKTHGITCDIRPPSVIRVTPAPLYNTFEEVYRFVHIFKNIWKILEKNESK